MTFDRLWCVYLENKLKIKRNKKTVTVMIFIVLSFVFAVDQVYMAYYVMNQKIPVVVFNQTLNKSVLLLINVAVCVQKNDSLVLAQDLIYVMMRIILPFIIMVVCNIILINHIRQSRKRVIRGRNEKKENTLTKTVALLNGSFIICNISVVVYYIVVYYNLFNGIVYTNANYYIFLIYGTSSILLSYLFTLLQFFLDMVFNKIFRKEILQTFLIVTGRRNRVEETRAGNTHNSTNL